MKRVGKILSNLLVAFMTLAMLGILAVIIVFYHYSDDLPDFKQLATYEPPIITRLYAGDGRLLAEYATEKRVYLPLSATPRRVIHAFLAAEDKNFYEHTGIDLFGIVRAMMENIRNFGSNRSLVGGSTITQQVVKNFLLTNEKSLERKIKEAILAFRISRVYSKDRILELYLNQIYLGHGSYGVAAAALNYFNKSTDELSVEEAAFLAALPKAPANYDPRRYYERAKERRDWVIRRMQDDGAISDEEALRAISMPITLRTRDEAETARADFFAEEVRRQLAAMYGSEVLYKGGLYVKTTLDPTLQNYADEALREALMEFDHRRGGWRGPVQKLASTDNWQQALSAIKPETVPVVGNQQLAVVLDVAKERASIGLSDGSKAILPLERAKWARKKLPDGLGPEPAKMSDVVLPGNVILVAPMLEKQNEKEDQKEAKSNIFELQQMPQINGALVALDPHTGRVLAMSGGYAYGGTEFNRATQAKRQPGSAFKPFVYLSALESGFTPATIIEDAPVELSQGVGLPTWKPQNYKGDYLGPATLRTGVEKSRNAMTVRLAVMLGIDRILAIGRRFDIYDKPQRNFSIVLGAAETTLIRLTNAYAMLVNGGKRVSPALIERIDDRNGKTIFRRDTRKCEKCRMETGAGITDSVPPLPEDNRERVVDARVAYQMVSILEGVVQRGTAARARSIGKPLAGKTGTTNDSLDTWFVGFSPDLVVGVFVGYDTPKTLGSRETGGSVALPGFIKFMERALADKPSTPFRIPPGIQLVKIDQDTGQPPIPGLEGRVIYEAFVTGEDIFIPKEKDDGKIDKKKNEEPSQPVPPPPGTIEPDIYAPDIMDPAYDGYNVEGPLPPGYTIPRPYMQQPYRPGALPPIPRRSQGIPETEGAPVEGTGGIY